MKKIANRWIILLFTACLITFLVIIKAGKPHLLVFHSYALDSSWARDITKGIIRILDGKPYSLRFYHLDTERHPEPEYLVKAARNSKQIIEDWKPDLIILVDDPAQELVGKHYVNDPDIDIVFAGVNGYAETYGYDNALNVTGILQRIPFDELKEVFRQILPPEGKRLFYLGDASLTGRIAAEQFREVSWEPFEMVKMVQAGNFDEWQSAVRAARETADLLVIGPYNSVKRSREGHSLVPRKELIQWTAGHTTIPIIGNSAHFVPDGGMMGLEFSPLEQGETAARMAVQILDEEKTPDAIPMVEGNQYFISVRESELKSRGIRLPKVYENFARATGKYSP